MNQKHTLEFDLILERLSALAYTEKAKAKCLSLTPCLNEREAKRLMTETTEAKRVVEAAGSPPLSALTDIDRLIVLVEAGDMLAPEQLERFSMFAASCRRLKQYLKRAESTGSEIAFYGGSILELSGLQSEIDRCIRGGQVDDRASGDLYEVRMRIQNTAEQIRGRLNSILAKNKAWFSDSFVSMRGGRYTLPVKREHKNSLPGTVVEISNTGGTCFIEPASVARLQQERNMLDMQEENEVRKVLYTLTALVGDALPDIRRNIEAMETLDFLFAKAGLSLNMKACAVTLCAQRSMRIHKARHPLLDAATAVPLHFELGNGTRGVVITGPNTGGKTVALKTVGLLSLMAQSGLHVPADADSVFALHDQILCDIGDGQSIAENLSTFSSHMKNIIEILGSATEDSLVLLDELGSGTDPAEGMGLAVAILEELCRRGCLFVATTHYPEVKAFANMREGLTNARMAFDRQNLKPLYRLEVGEAGESCALYIAKRLGMPEHILANAGQTAYGAAGPAAIAPLTFTEAPERRTRATAPRVVRETPHKIVSEDALRFHIGDSVIVFPEKETGIVYARANEAGEVGVQVKKEKRLVSHKRIKLRIPACELYPDDYDFSIVFDTVANRKARHLMGKRHVENNVAVVREGDRTSGLINPID